MGVHYKHTWPKALKAHRCDACCLPIDKGERYSAETGLYDGHYWTTKLHEFCYRLDFKKDLRYGVEIENDFYDVAFRQWRSDFWRRHGIWEEAMFHMLLATQDRLSASMDHTDGQRYSAALNVRAHSKICGIDTPKRTAAIIEQFEKQRKAKR